MNELPIRHTGCIRQARDGCTNPAIRLLCDHDNEPLRLGPKGEYIYVCAEHKGAVTRDLECSGIPVNWRRV